MTPTASTRTTSTTAGSATAGSTDNSSYPPSSYPVVLTQLTRVPCLVVGGGAVAERKVAGLLEAGARVRVISPRLTRGLAEWRDQGRLEHRARGYQSGDLADATLVIAATDDAQVNAQVASEAASAGRLVNVADAPARGNFHTVATVRRGDLLIGVSTGGSGPALAASIREELEAQFGPEYTDLLELLAELRRQGLPGLDNRARRRFWRTLVSDHTLAQLRAGHKDEVRAEAQALLSRLQARDIPSP